MIGYVSKSERFVMKKSGFDSIYPFATENVNGYFEKLNLLGKSILTVGSSLDQLFNAVICGATEITVFDINPNVRDYFEWKKEMLKKCKRQNFVKYLLQNLKEDLVFSNDVMDIDKIYASNNYLQNDASYEKLIALLESTSIQFIEGDIFKTHLSQKFDCIVFSNVLQYLNYFFQKSEIEIYKEILYLVSRWEKCLNKNGVLQLLYLYSYSYEDLYKQDHALICYNLRKIVSHLHPYSLDIEWVSGFHEKHDAIVTYTRK